MRSALSWSAWLSGLGAVLLCGALLPGSDSRAQKPGAAAAAAAPARTATWEELVPKDWDPFKRFRDRDPGLIREGSATELSMMREMREIWDNAPTRSDLDGARIRLPGYVVPLDATQDRRLTQFLLVPYFGACIHSPPPPANQIVHVTLGTPSAWRVMDAVWVTGTLSSKRQDSPMGTSGYTMVAEQVEAYRAPTQ